MKLAYLILAFKQPLQILRMVDRLNAPNVHFVIHMDRKSGDTGRLRQYLGNYPNVRIISTVSVNWGGFSQVQAELDMLRTAFDTGIYFKYFLLLSGQDYPIKSNNFLQDFFTRHLSDFIAFHDIRHLGVEYLNKFRFYHFYDVPWLNPKSSRKIALLSYLYFGSHKHLRKFLPGRKMYDGMHPFFGATKTALSYNTVKYVLEFVQRHPGFVKYMKHTETPDETFFQTVILNSARKDHIYEYDRYVEWLKTRKEGTLFAPTYGSLRYMDWSERGKPKPAVLELSHFDELRDTTDLFARKMDEQVSAQLMDRIDREILEKPTWVPPAT